MRDPRIGFNEYNESRVVLTLHFGGNHEKFLALVAPVLKTKTTFCSSDFVHSSAHPQWQLTSVWGNNFVLISTFRCRSKGALLDTPEFNFVLCLGSFPPGSGDFLWSFKWCTFGCDKWNHGISRTDVSDDTEFHSSKWRMKLNLGMWRRMNALAPRSEY